MRTSFVKIDFREGGRERREGERETDIDIDVRNID